MADKDLYSILGISREADQDEIKKAYRRQAMKMHPDRNPDDPDAEEKFKEIQQAYDILSDESKRAAYDRFGLDAAKGNFSGAGAGGFSGFSSAGFSDVFGDVFGDIFGSARTGAEMNRRGHDLAYQLEISLEEAFSGTEAPIRYASLVRCDSCKGSGAEAGSGKKTCPNCKGSGQIRMQQGFFSVAQTCGKCRGRGEIIEKPCKTCNGSGRVRQQRSLNVKVEAGMDTGDRIRLSGYGEAGELGGPPGDLYVEIHVREHPIFVREGNDLFCEVPIDFYTACLGGELEVPTLNGRLKLTIPDETQTGKLFRLRGKGMKSWRSGQTGDLYCRVIIETPVKLSKKQKELLEDFQKSLGDDSNKHAPKQNSWLDNVKNFFDNLKS